MRLLRASSFESIFVLPKVFCSLQSYLFFIYATLPQQIIYKNWMMLGIESEIEVEEEICNLSINSQSNESEKLHSLPSYKASTFDGEARSSLNRLGKQNVEKVRFLRSKIREIQKRQ